MLKSLVSPVIFVQWLIIKKLFKTFVTHYLKKVHFITRVFFSL